MRRLSRSLLIALAVAAVAGCGGGATASPSSSGAVPPSSLTPSTASGSACTPAAAGASPAVNVAIKDFAYSPQPIQAKVGDVIAWKNGDSAPHTATLEDDSCGTDTLAAGASGGLVFNVAGTYTYKCKIHPTQMKGFTIVVS